MRPALPRPIDRMARVQRPPIEANIGAETAPLDEPLRTIAAALAQALKRAKPKLVNVAAMWLDMIADRRRLDGAALRAILTQRMLEQLVPPDLRPAPGAIPDVPLRRLAPNTHNTQLFHLARLMALQSTQQSMFDCTPSLVNIATISSVRSFAL